MEFLAHSPIVPVGQSVTVPAHPVIYQTPSPEQQLRMLKTELIGIRRAQLKMVKQIEDTLEAIDLVLLRY